MARSPLDYLTRLVTRNERIVAGIMSGTSLDAVDVALLRIRGSGENIDIELLYYSETLFSEELQQRLFANMEVSSSNINDICLLHTALAHTYADAVRQSCQEAGLRPGELSLVGMHGQTMRHLPDATALDELQLRSTLQLGSASTLATLLGVAVVSDFRAADMALGGQGAPLVPRADWLLFRSDDVHRVILNIGGIANLTVLPRSCGTDDVVAFDTGPGNMLVDALMRRYYGREFDEDGAVARSGAVHNDLISWLLRNEYFNRSWPKSTGRELFGEHYADTYMQVARDLGITVPEDIVATAAECTVRSIRVQLQSLLPADLVFELYLAGGGARNRFFVDGIRMSFPRARIETMQALGVPPEAREAVCFAVLANEYIVGNPGNLPSVTGASREALLGSLSFPS
jgi:anhydro-N-acetylmuramic acid kinase